MLFPVPAADIALSPKEGRSVRDSDKWRNHETKSQLGREPFRKEDTSERCICTR